MHIGLRIKELREEKKLTQKQLSEIMGLKSDVSISDYEKAESLTIKTLNRIAKALEVSVSDLTSEGFAQENKTNDLPTQGKDEVFEVSNLTYSELVGKYINSLKEISFLKDEIIELQKKIIAKNGFK